MSLWWLQPGWTDATCAGCGTRIWPEGDPDWGLCFGCMSQRHERHDPPTPRCDICGTGEGCASTNGYVVCSEACDHEAMARGTNQSKPGQTTT